MTERLQRVAAPGDTVARLGGDEFAIVQRQATPASASELASKIIAELAEPFEVQSHQLIVGTSIGIAMAPADGSEPDQLLRNADMALYRAKSDGRGTYHFFQPEMDAQMQERRKLELDLRKALQSDEFELNYQPLIDLARGEVCGFEALLRWNHPERGLSLRADLHGRFRHRLFVIELFAQLPLRQDQDRPFLHPRTRQKQRLHGNYPRHHAARFQPGHDHHRRRGRDRGTA